MPGTTRYSATFDRTYEEEAKPSSPPNARRSRSQSWQANSGHDGRQYTPFASRSPAPRSSSQDNNPARGTEFIPTRTAKTSVKAHNNPFQFVKVGTCPLYKKAEEQLKKVKEIKKPDVLKEEEEEWQSNLDSWKSRRRKMSEDVFRRQEEIKLLELEEQIAQVSQKKTKTFSEMVESRATRGRALSLCLLTSPLEFQNWEYENKTHKNGSCSYTDESGENSTVNSEDEGVSMRRRHSESALNENEVNHNRTNGDAHTEHNGSKLDTQNGNCNKLSTNGQLKPKENSYIDSGLESISSSHRAGDTPDTGSDFSQDSNSSIDCDSPRTGVNVLEEFNAKSSQISDGHEINITLSLDEKGQDFGFTFLGGKDEGQVIIVSILEGSKAESSGVHLGDRIITINGCDVNSKKHIEIAALIQKGREKGLLNLLLWRHNKSANNTNESSSEEKLHKVDKNLNAKLYEKSIESENEMYVDDFEELKRQSELLANKKSDITNGNTEAPTNGNKSSNNDAKSFKTSTASSTAPILKINSSNSAVEKPDIDGKETKINNENQKKNIIKVKRVRRKGVYALNVDSNHNSQDGNSINSLFPLSPVTELPSPADETKTIASSLPSDDKTLLNSNSQNGILNDGKQDGAEKQAETRVIQENNSSESISTKIENSKSAVLQTGLKDIDTKIKMNSENKTEITNAQLLNSKSKDSADDKSKSLTNSKKSKSNKLKKIITSENTSVAPKSTKEFSSAAQLSDVTSNSVIQEKSSSDLKSYILESEQTDMKKIVEKPVVSEAMGNKVSCENVSIKSATEIVSIPNKTPETNTISHGNEIQSTDIVANGIETPSLNKQSNVSTSPEKPKKSMQKKTIAKPKAHPTEKSSVITTDAVLNEIYSTKEQSSFSVTEKQEKIASKNETTASLLQEENNVSLNDDVANKPQEIIIFPAKDETPIVSPSTNKVKDLALKFGEKSASTNSEPSLLSKNPKPDKSPLNEKSKPIFAKKENIKAKENGVEQNLTNSLITSNSSISNTSDSSSKSKTSSNSEKQVKAEKKNEIMINSSKMENGVEQNPTSSLLTNSSLVSNTSDSSSKNKTTSNNEKQVKAEKKNEIVIDSSKMEKSVQQHFVTSQTMKQPSIPTVSSVSSTKSTNKESKTKKVKVESASCPDKQSKIATKNQTVSTSHKRDNSDAQVCLNNKQVTNKAIASSITNTSDSCTSKNPIKGIQVEKEKKIPLTQDMEVKTVNKNNKVSPLTRENDNLLSTGINSVTTVDKQLTKIECPKVPLHNTTSMITSVNKTTSDNVSSEVILTQNNIPNSPVDSPSEKPKLPTPKRCRNRSKKKNANSQKVNSPANSNEESKGSNDLINVVFQSQPKSINSENLNNNNTNFESNNNKTSILTDLVTDVPPVDKIAEEMEKLILEQLEEEERAKELSSGKISVESSPEHLLIAPPKMAEPPKEKPPPPPINEGSPKDSSLKRVNSTKRIKKEIHKRRSNFLGIENTDESIICSEPTVPPPPALEEILKAEMELDRQTRLRIENEATERLTLEEKEIMLKEREIIESIESEERQKMYLNGIEDSNNIFMPSPANEALCGQDRIKSLKSEIKRIETEQQLSDEQQQILLEEKQLKEREEFIRQQEASISTVSLSNTPLSVSANTANNFQKPALSSMPNEAQSNGLLLGANGDGKSLSLSSPTAISVVETSKSDKKNKAVDKPAVPPKPLKKKEAIRKERERLRQEQEALQREREEHRRKLMQEQEELMKQQKTHAPDAPVSRLGPHPPHVQPSFPSQLTTTINATPNARENASFPSRSHHGTTNNAAGSINAVELMGPPIVRQNRLPAPRKAVQNEAWGQQKMPSVRKQNHESLTESRYNQNHWLIQEAEMRRIAELKERQRTTQPPCTQTHLAEDDVCSNPSRVPVISPTHNPQLNYPENVWNYGQSNIPLKKYPPPVVKEPPLHAIYPRETVSQQPPSKPSRIVPSERQEQMLSVSGRKRCSHCNEELGRGAAMIIESLQLYYHIHCFQCCVCQAQLGNGSCGTDVRVRNNKLHCHNCYSNDEAGLKFSQV